MVALMPGLQISSFNALHHALSGYPSDAPLVFQTRDHTIKGGYHVTELKVAEMTGIDCGGKITRWSEASMQIMDGFGGPHMPVGKFLGLLGHSIRSVQGLGDEAAFVEFSPMNVGLRSYQIGSVSLQDNRVIIALKDRGPMCKAAERVAVPAAEVVAKATCCGISLPTRCC